MPQISGAISKMKFVETIASHIPMELLLQADPWEESVRSYLDSGLIFAAIKDDVVIGVVVAGYLSDSVMELFNVSVSEAHQGQGVGTELLEFVLQTLKTKGVARVELGTGTFGYQLAYYQRAGFRVESVVKDHFLTHYPDPIFDNGIQLKDMLRLSASLG